MSETIKQADFELIVHIGSGKTGSSSIQKTLGANRGLLTERGIAYFGIMCEDAPCQLYPWQVAGGWEKLVEMGDQNATQQLHEVLSASIRTLLEQGYRRAIWSNETIFGNDKIVIPVLKQLDKLGIDTKIIVYIRRHDAWARSAYLQWGVKHKAYKGPVKPFKTWYQERRISFASGLRPWLAEHWADMAVRNFDTCGDVVQDFLGYYSLSDQNLVPVRENETPGAVAIALWSLFNSQFENPVLPAELEGVLKTSGLLQADVLDFDFAALLPTKEDLDAVRMGCAGDREEVNAILSRYAQPEISTSDLREKATQVTQNQINAALLRMISYQSAEIERLKKKLR